MDLCLAIKKRLRELGLEQKELAAAAQVTDSYISQLLTGKKLPPDPDRTDIYEKMGKFLKLSNGELAKLARAQRTKCHRAQSNLRSIEKLTPIELLNLSKWICHGLLPGDCLIQV